MERRFLGSEVRVSADGGEISGYAAVYYDGTADTEYQLRDDVVERVMSGAFDAVLEEKSDVKALWNHKEDLILGRVKSGTLRLASDKRGLKYTIKTANTTLAADVREHIRRGDAGGSSFAFTPVEERWTREGSMNVRELREVDVYDVSVVVDPAYKAATVATRAVGDPTEALESLDRHLGTTTIEIDGKKLADIVVRNVPPIIRKPAAAKKELPPGIADRRTAERVEAAIAEQRKRAVISWPAIERIEARRCADRLYGAWCVEPRWMLEAATAIKAGLWPAVRSGDDDDDGEDGYEVHGGIAVVDVCGKMTKGGSSFGGCSTVRLRAALRRAAEDDEVSGILLRIDSPGGTVAGTEELAFEVRRVGLRKPVHAHIEDLGASAAYWVASQCRRVTATPLAEVGSIGVICVVRDVSGLYAREGIKVHVVATGDRKGDFAPGVPVTDESLSVLRGELDVVHQHFLRAVTQGRQADPAAVAAWADGRCYDASRAVEMGLIDAVAREDEALEALREAAREVAEAQAKRREIAERAAAVEGEEKRRRG